MLKQSKIETVLDTLEAAHAQLLHRDGLLSPIADDAGHAAVHVARRATEDVFLELHAVSDIAPQLRDSRVYGVAQSQARVYLRESPSSGSGVRAQVTRAVAKLVQLLKKTPKETFQTALAAKEVAILLLGPTRLGGAFAEWQASTLGVGLLTWIEQQSLNLRVLGQTQKMNVEQAKRDAQAFDLPDRNFVQMGCYGNIAKACFRAVVEDECEGFSPEEVAAVGSTMLEKIDREVTIDPAYRRYILPMVAMEAAVLEELGGTSDLWTRLSRQAEEILQEIEATEPSAMLREAVLGSARRSADALPLPLKDFAAVMPAALHTV